MQDIDKQFLLYAKCHYARSDTIADLKTIISKTYLIPVECIKKEDVLQVILDSAFRILKEQNKFNEEIVKLIVSRASPGQAKYMLSNETYDFYRDFCESLLTELMKLKCVDNNGQKILDIGIADPDILPRSRATLTRLNNIQGEINKTEEELNHEL